MAVTAITGDAPCLAGDFHYMKVVPRLAFLNSWAVSKVGTVVVGSPIGKTIAHNANFYNGNMNTNNKNNANNNHVRLCRSCI